MIIKELIQKFDGNKEITIVLEQPQDGLHFIRTYSGRLSIEHNINIKVEEDLDDSNNIALYLNFRK